MNIKFPLIELLDRLVISKIKIDKGIDSSLEFNFYNNQAKEHNLSAVSNLLDELEIVHRNIWALEAELKSGKEQLLPLEELGRRAIAIRDLNNQRIKIKNAMAEILHDPIRELKKDHLSQ